jgi:pantoate--beta-alanine ligase
LAEGIYCDGEHDAGVIRLKMRELIAHEPLASVDYVSVADACTLRELEIIEVPALVSIAVRIGKTRLIDNILLGGC